MPTDPRPLDNIDRIFTVNLDMHGLRPDTMTDIGIPLSELEPIEDCVLTPGHPSPVGRSVDGDLAYPVHETEEHVRFSRMDFAIMANMVAKQLGVTRLPLEFPLRGHGEALLHSLVSSALPDMFFSDSAHEAVRKKAAFSALLDGRFSDLPDFVRKSGPVWIEDVPGRKE